MSEEAVESIWVITAEPSPVVEKDGSKGGTSSNPWGQPSPVTTGLNQGTKISVTKLETEMSKFLQIVGGLFNRAQQQVNQQAGLKLEEIELTVEISAEGELKLLGTGGKAGTKGGITLKFKRSDLKKDG